MIKRNVIFILELFIGFMRKDFFGPLIDNIGDAFPKYRNPGLSSWLKQ